MYHMGRSTVMGRLGAVAALRWVPPPIYGMRPGYNIAYYGTPMSAGDVDKMLAYPGNGWPAPAEFALQFGLVAAQSAEAFAMAFDARVGAGGEIDATHREFWTGSADQYSGSSGPWANAAVDLYNALRIVGKMTAIVNAAPEAFLADHAVEIKVLLTTGAHIATMADLLYEGAQNEYQRQIDKIHRDPLAVSAEDSTGIEYLDRFRRAWLFVKNRYVAGGSAVKDAVVDAAKGAAAMVKEDIIDPAREGLEQFEWAQLLKVAIPVGIGGLILYTLAAKKSR